MNPEHLANDSTDEKVKALERCVLDLIPLLATWKNSFVKVNRLPPEIIARVGWFLPSRDIYAGLRVCRYWHNVLMSPEIWSDIDLDHIGVAQIFLSRSKGVPINIRITQSPGEMQLSTLSDCSSRIRSLDITFRAVSKCLLTHFSNTPASLMRHLRVGISPTYSHLPSTFFTGSLPSLRSLVLSDLSSDLTHLVLPNLTTFTMSRSTTSDTALSLSSLLDFLERSPLLENLYLNYHSRYEDPVATKRIVTLHRLESVHISGQPLTPADASRGLLAHLSLPLGVMVELRINPRELETDIVARAIPLHHDLIPCTKSIKKIEFQCMPSNFCVMAFSGDYGVLRIFANWRVDCEAFTTRSICSFGSLDVSGVETLVVEGYDDDLRHFTQALATLTSLRSLTLLDCDNKSLLHALRNERMSPRLQHLTMDFTHTRGTHVADLVGVAEARKLRGLKLETLSLDLSSRDAGLVGDIASLQEYVGSLEDIADIRSDWWPLIL